MFTPTTTNWNKNWKWQKEIREGWRKRWIKNGEDSKESLRRRRTDKGKYKYKVVPRPNVCYICQKQGLQGFKILYWLSSCDDTDKDKNPILCIIRGEYFSGVNIFQGWIFFGGEYFQEWIFSGEIFFRAKYFLGVNIFRSEYMSFSQFTWSSLYLNWYFYRLTTGEVKEHWVCVMGWWQSWNDPLSGYSGISAVAQTSGHQVAQSINSSIRKYFFWGLFFNEN